MLTGGKIREIFQAAAACEDPRISVRAAELYTGTQWGKATWRLGRINIRQFGREMYYERALMLNLNQNAQTSCVGNSDYIYGLPPMPSRSAHDETEPKDLVFVLKRPTWTTVMGFRCEPSYCTHCVQSPLLSNLCNTYSPITASARTFLL